MSIICKHDGASAPSLSHLIGVFSVELLDLFQTIVELREFVWTGDGIQLVFPHTTDARGETSMSVVGYETAGTKQYND